MVTLLENDTSATDTARATTNYFSQDSHELVWAQRGERWRNVEEAEVGKCRDEDDPLTLLRTTDRFASFKRPAARRQLWVEKWA